jgi:amino acid adenylation domain-containing protein
MDPSPNCERAVYIFPASSAQRGMWFLQQLDPSSPAYNITAAVRITGGLEVECLERSLQEVTARHESLRTRFAVSEEGLQQVIEEHLEFQLELIDLSKELPDSLDGTINSLVLEETRRPFSLASLPLVRATLVRSRLDEHILVLVMHHSISDGWSSGIMIKEIALLYEAFAAGISSPLPPLPIQYADFSAWQEKQLRSEALVKQMLYWKEQLRDIVPLELPTETGRSVKRSTRGKQANFSLGSELVRGLRKVVERHGATLYMTLLAGFATLLYRYTGQTDITIGSPMAGRTKSELEQLIGLFVNMLVVRVRMDRQWGWDQLLSHVREVMLDAHARQVPFEKLVEILSPERDPSRTPLFRVVFTLENAPTPVVRLANIELRPVEIESHTAKFDLTFALREHGDEVLGTVEFNSDLFDDSRIRNMIQHYEVILNSLARESREPLSMLPLLTPSEVHQQLEEWNHGQGEHGQGEHGQGEEEGHCPVHILVEQQAAHSPDAVALVCEASSVTYGELNSRSNQLANYLRKAGVGLETPVAICMERNAEMVIAWLAVLKAGGAYAPFDHGSPEDRLLRMITDLRPQVILTSEKLMGRLAAAGRPTISLDRWEEIGRESTSSPRQAVHPDNLAYVVYTSGSTGQPKGVAIPQRGLMNLVAWHVNRYQLGHGDRTTQSATAGFDAAGWEAWPTLVAGATLYFIDDSLRVMPADIPAWLSKEKITISFLATPLAEAVLKVLWPSKHALRFLLTGGDKLGSVSRTKSFTLVNHYGPTENSVVTTFHEVSSEGDNAPALGVPIRNLRVYILDDAMQLRPVGLAGELCIGGAGLARGYKNHPDLTAASFVPDPFSKRGGERLYRTGDQVRYRPDGNIEFLGRGDRQIKIRGHRIELGEIESVVQAQKEVAQAVVVSNRDQAGNDLLIAYIVPRTPVTGDTLKEALKSYLPTYMIPSVFMMLDELPLTPNGKVDRQSLPNPTIRRRSSTSSRFSWSPLQETAALIWEDMLKISINTLEENFFEIGGHSLLATQVVSRINAAFGIALPLRSIFDDPTLAGFAERIECARAVIGEALPFPRRFSREGDLPLSRGQQQFWAGQIAAPLNPQFNISLGVRLKGVLDVTSLRRALQEIVNRHESLRSRFLAAQGVPHLIIEDEAALQFPIIDLRSVPKEEGDEALDWLSQEDAQKTFDLRHAPLFRPTLVQCNDLEHCLLLTIHHIVFDGWSFVVFLRELSALYTAFTEGRPSSLPPLALQHLDFVYWQEECLSHDRLQQQLHYWKKQLANLTPPVVLPRHQLRVTRPWSAAANEPMCIEADVVEQLRRLCNSTNATLYMALIASIQLLIYSYTGQLDLTIGSPIAGRTHHAFENLIGLFRNTIVIRTQLSEDWSFNSVLQNVKETVLGAYANQDVPFLDVLQATMSGPNPATSQLFRIMLVVQNMPVEPPTLGTLALEEYDRPLSAARFDLKFSLWETGSEIKGVLEYDKDLLQERSGAKAVQDYLRLLDCIVSAPEQAISALPSYSTVE